MSDTDRLDWLERTGAEIRSWSTRTVRQYSVAVDVPGRVQPVHVAGETLRQAIDAAMGAADRAMAREDP